MDPTMPETAVDRIRHFNRTYVARLGLFARDYVGLGHSVSEFRVLREFREKPEISAREVALELDMDEAQISRTIKRFVDKGWLTRKPSEVDARRKIVTLTDAGLQALSTADSRGSAKTIERLGADKIDTLAQHTDEILRLLGHAPQGAIDIRDLSFGDAAWVTQRHAETYAINPGFNPDFEPFVFDILSDFITKRDPNRERAFIAWRGQKRIGSIFCTASDKPDLAKLRLFFVEPAARGHGLGKRLMNDCLTFARASGYKRMTLVTHETQTTARAMYASAGFTCTTSRPDHLFGRDAVEETWDLEL